MVEFVVFYALKVVQIAVYVLVIAAVVGLIEKILGVDTTPHIDKLRRNEERAEALLKSTPPVTPG